jgi:CBS domain containing-hemolysin-like protein
MPPGDLLPAVVMLGACLLLAAFFAASETALFSLKRSERSRLAGEPSEEARAATNLLARPRTLLVVILLIGVAIDALFFSVSADIAAAFASSYGALAIPVSGALAVALMLAVGEITPKAIAASAPRRTALIAARPLLGVRDALRPLTAPVERGLAALLDWVERRLPESRPGLRDAELVRLVEQEQADGRIERRASELLADVLDLHARRVKEVMVPRVDLQFFGLDEGRERFLSLLREKRHQHIPVHDGRGVDGINGFLRGRRVLAAPETPLAKLVEPAKFVPETMSLETLLRTMAAEKRTAAIVVDEHGGTAGLVTLEDVVEEIVGDIASPLDAPLVRATGDGTWLVSGRLGLKEAGDMLGVRFAAKGPTTLSGYIALQLGRVPEKGDEVVFPNVRLRVEAVVRRRATEVTATRTGARA